MKVRRKIMALGTALAMAFVMIASLVLVTDVKADEPTPITSLNVTIEKPVADVIVDSEGEDPTTGEPYGQTNRPVITINDERINHTTDYIGGWWTVKTDSFNPSQPPANFYGKFVDGETYGVVFWCMPVDGYTLSDTIDIKVNGQSISSSNFTTSGGAELYAYATIACGEESGGGGTEPSGGDAQTPTTEVQTLQNGESATLNPAADGTVSFRIEKEFEHFQNGGKLYIDGQEVPTDQYYATQGSTIITLVKEYAAKLADGLDHAVKVVFDDGEFNATIKVSPASSDSTAANGTSGTASSTAATTTKVTSPKTADVLPIAGIALVFVGATAIGVIAFRRKNS